MRKKLTTKAVENLKPDPDKRLTVSDLNLPGFGLRISPGGKKSWFIVYRNRAGKQRRMTLGSYPRLSLAEAREEARKALGRAELGIDPQDEKIASRRSAPVTFNDLKDEFIEKHSKVHTRHAVGTERRLERAFGRSLGNTPISDISKRDIIEALDSLIENGVGVGANRALAAGRKMFNWAIEQGHIETSPFQGVRAPVKENSRDRVLTPDEIKSFWQGCDSLGWPFGSLFQLLLLTAQRRGETAAMRWRDLDLDAATWTIPKEATKSLRSHVVPLSPQAVDIIESVPRIDGVDYLFSTNALRPVSGFGRVKSNLDDMTNTGDWRLHDLRRTAASGLAEIHIAPHIIEKILNHASGQLGGLAGVYNRYQYLDEKREALHAWGDHVQKVIEAIDDPPKAKTFRRNLPSLPERRGFAGQEALST